MPSYLDKKPTLSPRQMRLRRFCELVAELGNASQADRRDNSTSTIVLAMGFDQQTLDFDVKEIVEVLSEVVA